MSCLKLSLFELQVKAHDAFHVNVYFEIFIFKEYYDVDSPLQCFSLLHDGLFSLLASTFSDLHNLEAQKVTARVLNHDQQVHKFHFFKGTSLLSEMHNKFNFILIVVIYIMENRIINTKQDYKQLQVLTKLLINFLMTSAV